MTKEIKKNSQSYPSVRVKHWKGAYKEANQMGLRALYEAAGSGPRADTFKFAFGFSSEYLLGKSLDVIQRRVLHEVRNNPLAGRIVDTIVRTTIGNGLKPKISDPDLKKLWNAWSKQACSDGRKSFDEMLALAIRETCVKGEIFGRHRARFMDDVRAGRVPVPYQVELISSEQCPLTEPGDTLNTDPSNPFRSGIYFSPIGWREAFLFLRRHPRNGDMRGLTTNDYVRVSADDVMHVFQDRENGQLRGEPWLVRSLVRLHELDQYMDAELEKKKSAARLTGIWKAPSGQANAQMIEDENGEVEEVSPDFIPPKINSGAQLGLPPGWSFEGFRAHEVGGDFEVFVRNVVREACNAAHAPYELVTGDFSQTQERMVRFQYKAVYEQTVHARRQMLINQFASPVFKRFVQEAYNAGLWTPPSGETWQDHAYPEWQGQPMPYPNPLQEANTNRVLLEAGAKSLSEWAMERGKDPDELAQELRDDLERFKGLPISFILKHEDQQSES